MSTFFEKIEKKDIFRKGILGFLIKIAVFDIDIFNFSDFFLLLVEMDVWIFIIFYTLCNYNYYFEKIIL